MRATTYSTTALVILSAFWSPVSGVAVGQDSTSGAFGGKQHAHTLVHMDITDGEEYGLLHSYCSPKRQLHCDRILATIGSAIASSLKSDSDNNDCAAHTGSVDDVSWESMQRLKTIAGAIDVYLRAQDKAVCGVHCIRLTHGGTYSGHGVQHQARLIIGNNRASIGETRDPPGIPGTGDLAKILFRAYYQPASSRVTRLLTVAIVREEVTFKLRDFVRRAEGPSLWLDVHELQRPWPAAAWCRTVVVVVHREQDVGKKGDVTEFIRLII
ncbi:hypothetical protein R3P38DRAFT_2799921 [Favolaschia claudopus]|uniref:Secreted protein CSS2 C-terminal domain-containing protein n=1 Tax=Favolaschia claudopus TaxID=2862362 RepID=A0AAV9ZZC4_9AGAR